MTEPGGPPEFDPRHDARFQRGYRPGAGTDPASSGRRGRSSAAHPDPADPSAAPSPQAGVARPAGRPSVADPGTDQPRNDPDYPDELDELAFDTDAFHDEPEPSRWNPFIAVLWVMGLAFVLAAGTLQYLSVSLSYSNMSYSGNGPLPIGMLIQQLGYSVAPSVLTAGLIIVAGLLFWHAAAWRARRRPAPPR